MSWGEIVRFTARKRGEDVVRGVIVYLPSIEPAVARLVADLSDAADEGQHELEELLAVLPARLRTIFRHNVTIQPVERAPIAPVGGSETTSVLAVSSTADGSPATARAGRPLGLSTRRQQLLAGDSAVPNFSAYRRGAQLSRSDIASLAEAAGREISKNTIGRIESGEVLPSRHHAEAIAAALSLPLEDVLSMLELAPSHVVEV